MGLLSTAPPPLPSPHPAAPLPARLLTAPPLLTTRSLWLPVSSTSSAPLGVASSPAGLVKLAPASAGPSLLPAPPLPAAVLTATAEPP